jgi:hypothetical protein
MQHGFEEPGDVRDIRLVVDTIPINRNPRDNSLAFNATIFSPNALGTFGNSSQRFFMGLGPHQMVLNEAKPKVRNCRYLAAGKGIRRFFSKIANGRFYFSRPPVSTAYALRSRRKCFPFRILSLEADDHSGRSSFPSTSAHFRAREIPSRFPLEKPSSSLRIDLCSIHTTPL